MPDEENNIQPEAPVEAPVEEKPAPESTWSVADMIDMQGKSTDAPRASWEYLFASKRKNVVVIGDTSVAGDGRRSVTNDAEYVVAAINAARAGVRIIYRDTVGDYTEIYHDRGVFRGYQPIQDVDDYIKAMY